jgi:hypothetical protein
MTAQTSKWGDSRFVHIQDNNLKRRVTAAFRYNDERQIIEFSLAQCSKKDTFCKRIGRTVSHGRLNSNHDVRIIPYESLDGDTGFKAVTETVVRRVLEELVDQ